MRNRSSLASGHLTKSRYIAGLQCLRRLWLLVHDPAAYEEPAPGSPMDIGQDIGRKARLLFPGGATVDEEPWQHAQAVARTTALMDDKSIPAIFEAAFEYDGIRIRVDVLERLEGDAWGLREVKSSTGLKDHYLDDIALQAFVLKGVGVPVTSIELVHVNSAYVRGPGGICWADFFARLDVGDAVATRLVDLPGRLPAMRDCLRMADQPDAEPGQQCGRPMDASSGTGARRTSPLIGSAISPVYRRPVRANSRRAALRPSPLYPSDFPLTPKQAIIRDATASRATLRIARSCAPASGLRASRLLPGFRGDDAAHSSL